MLFAVVWPLFPLGGAVRPFAQYASPLDRLADIALLAPLYHPLFSYSGANRDFQKMIRSCPKPVVAMVAGWAVGGGHVLHVMCDLTIAADNAQFMQTGPRVGSFDGGFGAAYLASIVGQKKAREIWYLCRPYSAEAAREMGLVNTVVPLAELEKETVQWCREMLALSPMALRLLKASFNAEEDGLAGIQQLAHDTNLLFYASEEAREGREAYKAKRRPDFGQFPKRP